MSIGRETRCQSRTGRVRIECIKEFLKVCTKINSGKQAMTAHFKFRSRGQRELKEIRIDPPVKHWWQVFKTVAFLLKDKRLRMGTVAFLFEKTRESGGGNYECRRVVGV